ncbi:MAG: hypothetical protein J5887_01610 [Erysipelotrichaceae bacterium]|nr:hypothetical protein [Erysipelotrichaceae bacterium]
MRAAILFNLKRRFFNRMTLLINAVLFLLILFLFHIDYFLGNQTDERRFYIDDSTRQFQSGLLSRERDYRIYNGEIGDRDILIHYDGHFTIISNSAVDDQLLAGIREDIRQAVRETYEDKYPELIPFISDYAGTEESISEKPGQRDSVWLISTLAYFLLMNYSGTVATEVIYEKSGHLLENLLNLLTPRQHLLSKIIQGYLTVLIQFLLAAVFAAAAFAIRYWEDGLAGLRAFLNEAEIYKELPVTADLPWQKILLIAAIMISGLMIVQTVMLLICSGLSGSEQAAGVQGLFYVLLLIGYYLMLMYGDQWIVSGRQAEAIAGLPVISLQLMSSLLMLNRATLLQGLLALGVNVSTLILIIELFSRKYRQNLLSS